MNQKETEGGDFVRSRIALAEARGLLAHELRLIACAVRLLAYGRLIGLDAWRAGCLQELFEVRAWEAIAVSATSAAERMEGLAFESLDGLLGFDVGVLKGLTELDRPP